MSAPAPAPLPTSCCLPVKHTGSPSITEIQGEEHVGRLRVPARLRGPSSATAYPWRGPGIPAMKRENSVKITRCTREQRNTQLARPLLARALSICLFVSGCAGDARLKQLASGASTGVIAERICRTDTFSIFAHSLWLSAISFLIAVDLSCTHNRVRTAFMSIRCAPFHECSRQKVSVGAEWERGP
jgi:hypothetical protein